VQVIIQISIVVAQDLLRHKPHTVESEALLKEINTLGLTLEPMHRNTDDPHLQKYFTMEVLDYPTAQLVINNIQQSEAVEAAYVKPLDELP
jgi:hypothetical protein